MNTTSQRQFLFFYTLWLLPAIAGVVLVIFGLVKMILCLEYISPLTLQRAFSFLAPLVSGCCLTVFSVMRLHKRRLAIHTSSHVDQLNLNQKRWLWVAPLALSITAAGVLLNIYWGVSVIRQIPSLVPFCCVILLFGIYFGFFCIRHWNEYPSPDHWKRFKCYSIVFLMLLAGAFAFWRII